MVTMNARLADYANYFFNSETAFPTLARLKAVSGLT
jgi:hypothetical protein